MPDVPTDLDVLVCGGGMAGLCAGLRAVEAGARVLVVEKGDEPGGSMRMSGGTIWTAPDMAVMERYVPAGDRERQRRLVDGLRPGLDWLVGHGVRVVSPIESPRQVGAEVDVHELTGRLAAAIESGGGTVATGTRLVGLDADGADGIAATVEGPDGSARSIVARSVIVATGGFGSDPGLTERHIGPFAATMLTRASERNTGDGLRAVLAAGGHATPSMDTFYGHTMPALPADVPLRRWTAVTQYYTQDALLINERGERFFDESRSMADETAPFEIVRQPNGRAWIVMDRRIHDEEALPGRSPSPVERLFAAAAAAGAPTVVASTLDELADGLADQGMDRAGLLATLGAFAAAVADGTTASLPVPRRGAPFALAEPPFRAIAVRAGITFTLGGIAVDADLRVLDDEDRPIPGLFAAGADAGGTYDAGYMGGLVLGLVQGRAAGELDAREARAARDAARAARAGSGAGARTAAPLD